MALPQPHFLQQTYQNLQPQPQKSQNFRNLYAIEGQISQPVSYYDFTNVQDQPQHPPYVPPFHHVAVYGPGPVLVADGRDTGADLQWNNVLEPKNKKLKEQDFLENNSQLTSVDFLGARSVSTGLGLSLDNGRMASSGDSPLLSFIGDDIDSELLRQDAEMDRFLKIQGDRLRQAVLEKVQANQLQTISLVEQKFLQKLREKEAEVESINKKNTELEERMEHLTMEANAWQQRARYNENMIATLELNLQQIHNHSRNSKEGCGDSEVDDTASCCNGRAIDFHLLCKEKNDSKQVMTCKVCHVNEISMLLLPCKHLCLCKDCESRLSYCPLCHSSKFIGVEVYM